MALQKEPQGKCARICCADAPPLPAKDHNRHMGKRSIIIVYNLARNTTRFLLGSGVDASNQDLWLKVRREEISSVIKRLVN
jgi:hypothetical protein